MMQTWNAVSIHRTNSWQRLKCNENSWQRLKCGGSKAEALNKQTAGLMTKCFQKYVHPDSLTAQHEKACKAFKSELKQI